MATQIELRKGKPKMNNPTPQQIRETTAAIQDTWSPLTRELRRLGITSKLSGPEARRVIMGNSVVAQRGHRLCTSLHAGLENR